jgi:hypothetical protein
MKRKNILYYYLKQVALDKIRFDESRKDSHAKQSKCWSAAVAASLVMVEKAIQIYSGIDSIKLYDEGLFQELQP